MHRRTGLVALALLMAAGCGTKSSRQPAAPIDSEQLNSIASTGPTVKEMLAAGNDTVPVTAPKAPFDYAGTWATSQADCAAHGWRFTSASATVAGDSACTVTGRSPRTDSEVKLTLDCAAIGTRAGAGMKTRESWALVKRHDGTMTVARTAGNAIPKSSTLTRCDG